MKADHVATITTHRNIVYRLLPGWRANARKQAGQAGACRFVWNEMPGRHRKAYEAAKASGKKPPSISFLSLGKRFTRRRQAVRCCFQEYLSSRGARFPG